MLQVSVLLENSSINSKFKTAHGLSLMINHNGRKILLDTGTDDSFIYNAHLMNIDPAACDVSYLSHSHYDHSGGLDALFKINPEVPVFTLGNPFIPYWSLSHGPFKYPIGVKASRKNKKRLLYPGSHDEKDCSRKTIPQCEHFLRITADSYHRPEKNALLLTRKKLSIVTDTFEHEGALVLEHDDNALAVFNSCSHCGVMNTIETVLTAFPGKKITSFIGGFHFPYAENDIIGGTDKNSMKAVAKFAVENNIKFITGHCTGIQAVRYLQNEAPDHVIHMKTGMIFDL